MRNLKIDIHVFEKGKVCFYNEILTLLQIHQECRSSFVPLNKALP